MRPPKREEIEYEKLDTNDFVSGMIEDINYDEKHQFRGGDGYDAKVRSAMRFKFMFTGYKFPHYSRWMVFNTGEKANLYLKYLCSLVEDAKPDMDFDMDELKGMKIRAMWSEKNGFQSLEVIRPLTGKLKPAPAPASVKDEDGRPLGEPPADHEEAEEEAPI